MTGETNAYPISNDIDEIEQDISAIQTSLETLSGTVSNNTARITTLERNNNWVLDSYVESYNVLSFKRAAGSHFEYVKRNGFCTVKFWYVVYAPGGSFILNNPIHITGDCTTRVETGDPEEPYYYSTLSLPKPIGPNWVVTTCVSTEGTIVVASIPLTKFVEIDKNVYGIQIDTWGNNLSVLVNGEIIAGTITYACDLYEN